MKLCVPRFSIHWEAAHHALRAAVEQAVELDVNISVAIVDCGGTEIAFLHMPDASLHSADVARDKAYTAASFGFPTKNWSDLLKTFSPEVQAGIVQRPRLVVFGGGVPIVINGEVIGAIGVSGASEQQDEICAHAGLAFVKASKQD